MANRAFLRLRAIARIPMSDRRPRSTIAGTPCMGMASAASAASSLKPEELFYLKTAPGVAIVAAARMLDPVACGGMEVGAPRVAVSALVELHHLLIEQGIRRSFRDDPPSDQEEQDERPAGTGTTTSRPVPTRHAVRFRKAPGDEPRRAQDGARRAGQAPVGARRRRSGGA